MTETSIKVTDQIGSQKNTLELIVPTLQLTIRELINLRVHQEFMTARLLLEDKTGLPQKTEAEMRKGIKTQFAWMGQIVDMMSSLEVEAERAQSVFCDGKFFIFIDDKQQESLDTEILLAPESTVQFIRLVPLIGG